MQHISFCKNFSPSEFEAHALDLFRYQYHNCEVYQQYCNLIGVCKKQVKSLKDIPFLPISFFKTHKVLSDTSKKVQAIFESSGTTSSIFTSKHHVTDTGLYEKSFRAGFEYFYGDITQYCVLALLPAYLERQGSSLVYMANDFIEQSGHPKSGFYLDNLESLAKVLQEQESKNQKTLLLGVSFALWDLAEQFPMELKNTIVMETGGMKGRKKELVREELHKIYRDGFGNIPIHSEYGMTELLSQGYSKGEGVFNTVPWLKVCLRDATDPLSPMIHVKEKAVSGAINIIDFANVNSCSFIATQDLGKIYPNGSFEVLGRFDHSDIRGCNLMVL